MSKRTRRLIKSILVVLLALTLGAVIAVWAMLRQSLPPTSGTVTVRGPGDTITITFDSVGVPRIWARTEHDALFALGWQHAADRMFQMDLVRRVSQGRLSQMLGDFMLELDIQQRRIGHTRLARRGLENLSELNRGRLQAYADGINAYKRHGGMPFEFRLLPVGFEDWSVYDCLTVLSFEMWYSDALQNHDAFYAELHQSGYGGAVGLLPPAYPAWAPSTVERSRIGSRPGLGMNPGRLLSDSPDAVRRSVAAHLAQTGPGSFRLANASNAWVIAPQRSSSGAAMLASDPHLELTRLPQFWYAVGLHVEETSRGALGISVPGLPFIIMGHNGRAAWAFTAAGVDITDYYIERLHPGDSTRYLAAVRSGQPDSLVWADLLIDHDTINVAGRDSAEFITVRRTPRGPLVRLSEDPRDLYSVRWAGYDTDFDKSVEAGFDLMEVSDFDSFRLTVTSLGAIDANWMYADSAGTIGYQLGTPVPIRGYPEHLLPLEGWIPGNSWQGYRSRSEVPWSVNPARGWLASCNNRPGSDLYIPGNYAADRILRITDLLASREEFSTDDLRDFQMDRTDSYVLRWRPVMRAALADLGDTTGAAAILAEWDGSADTSSRAAALALAFLEHLPGALFDDRFGAHAGGIGRFTADQVFFDTASAVVTPEQRRDAAREAMRRALSDTGGRSLGERQTLTMRHPMAGVPILGRLLGLSRGPWPRGGTAGTLNSAFSRQQSDGSFDIVAGPSWRFVIDFANVDSAIMVLPAGNSGNPMSPHFFDCFERWRSGEYFTVPFTRESVEAAAASTLRLVPDTDPLKAER